MSCTCLILLYAEVFPTPIPPAQLCPTDHIVPSSFTMKDSHCPIPISFTSLTCALPVWSSIYTGKCLSVLVPSPRIEPVFEPQPTTSPVSKMANHWNLQAVIFFAFGNGSPFTPFTGTGVRLSTVFPCASCPLSLTPHTQIVPSFFNAIEKWSPAATSITSVSPIFCGI